MDNLFEIKYLNISWDNFSIIDGGSIISRNFVESKLLNFNQYGINPSQIISLNICGSYGYSEYIVIENNRNNFRCGQILGRGFCKSPEGDMKIEVILKQF